MNDLSKTGFVELELADMQDLDGGLFPVGYAALFVASMAFGYAVAHHDCK